MIFQACSQVSLYLMTMKMDDDDGDDDDEGLSDNDDDDEAEPRWKPCLLVSNSTGHQPIIKAG